MPASIAVAPECGTDCPCRHIALVEGPRCRCGLYLLGDSCPYCETAGVGGRRRAIEPTREYMRADANARLDAVRAETVARATEYVPRKKRRSKETMAAVRAADKAKLDAIAREVTPAWLDDQNEVEADFLVRVKGA